MNRPNTSLLLFLLLAATSCAPPPNPSPGPAAIERPSIADDADALALRALADRVLVMLASRDYQQLPTLLDPGQKDLASREIAAYLLGPDAATSVLEAWDPGKTSVAFSSDGLRATASAHVAYHRRPNHPAIDQIFTFHFQRTSHSAPWRLVVP